MKAKALDNYDAGGDEDGVPWKEDVGLMGAKGDIPQLREELRDVPFVPEYLAENPQPPGVIKHPAHNRATFAGKVAILEQMKQFTHLIIDARGAGIKPRRCVEIRELLAHLNRQAS